MKTFFFQVIFCGQQNHFFVMSVTNRSKHYQTFVFIKWNFYLLFAFKLGRFYETALFPSVVTK
jgi:hypothetical protein